MRRHSIVRKLGTAVATLVIAVTLAAVHGARADDAPTGDDRPVGPPPIDQRPRPSLPSPRVLDDIVRQLNEDDQETIATLAPARQHAGRVVCGMRNYRLLLKGPHAREERSHSVLVNPTSESTRGIHELFSVIRVLHVDADGSPRSYHPEDPHGRGRCTIKPSGAVYDISGVCALDEFASGGIKVFRDGKKLGGTDLVRQWGTLWSLIRDHQVASSDLNAIAARVKPKHDYYMFHAGALSAVFKRDIVPPTKAGYPCTYGPRALFPGYFISATTLNNLHAQQYPQDVAPSECHAERYVDPEKVPFFVLPGGSIGNVRIGDVVIAATFIGGEQRLVYGIVGDAGPAQGFGEGSIAFIQELLGKGGEPVMNGAAVNALDIGHNANISVALLILGGTKPLFAGEYTHEQLERVGRAEFARWGGADPVRRLKACMAQLQGSP
ncbi:MAG TPA: hypothetical protein VFB45_05510 [Pseudolabrys sp.]|nr:hypothetical protein [Pseudolabrys sp.]